MDTGTPVSAASGASTDLKNFWIAAGAVSGLIATIAGAFAAHALKDRLDPAMLAAFETGARYQMYHSLALLAVAALGDRLPDGEATAAAWLFAAGIVLFCGSLYALALTGHRSLGMVTPFGGLAFMAGWGCLTVGAWRGGKP